MGGLEQVTNPLYLFIDGPFKDLTIKFVALFVVISGLEFGLVFLKNYITRKRKMADLDDKISRWTDL